MSEESEELSEFARTHLPHAEGLVARLAESAHEDVRWQAVDVLGDATTALAGDVLRRAFRDSAPYVRQRAYLAFARHRRTTPEMVERILADAAPYVRSLALVVADATRDSGVIDAARRRMLHDSVDVVRAAAAARTPLPSS